MEINYENEYLKSSFMADKAYEDYANAVNLGVGVEDARRRMGKAIYACEIAYSKYLEDWRRNGNE